MIFISNFKKITNADKRLTKAFLVKDEPKVLATREEKMCFILVPTGTRLIAERKFLLLLLFHGA